MATISNVIAGDLTIKIQRHATWVPLGFEMYEKKDGLAIDLTTLDDVRMAIVDITGTQQLELRIGEGFEIINNEVTGCPTILKMDVAYVADNLAAGWYRHDMMVVLGGVPVVFPIRGFFIVEQNFTQ